MNLAAQAPQVRNGIQIMHHFLEEVWNKGNENAVDELYAVGGTAHGLGEEHKDGPEQFKVFHRFFRQTCTDFHAEVKHILEEGDKVSMYAVIAFTHKASGKKLQLEGGGFARISDGKIVEAWNAWNFMELLIQMGYLPQDVFVQAMLNTK